MHLRYTEDDVTIIVLSNNESHAEFIADGLASIVLKQALAPPYVHKEISLQNIPGKFTGKYMLQLTRPPYLATFPVSFVQRDGKLYIESSFTSTIALIPESATKFFYADGTDQQVEFETDSNGEVLKLWHIAWGIKKLVKKMD
jgi:hypothetical protein